LSGKRNISLDFSSRLIIRKHDIHVHNYADDTQLYLSMKPGETNQSLRRCGPRWAVISQINIIVLSPKNLRESLSNDLVTLDGIAFTSSSISRNLGVIFDQISFNPH